MSNRIPSSNDPVISEEKWILRRSKFVNLGCKQILFSVSFHSCLENGKYILNFYYSLVILYILNLTNIKNIIRIYFYGIKNTFLMAWVKFVN